MKKLRLSNQVREFILSETRYLALHSPAAALRFRADLRKCFGNLAKYPNLGRVDHHYPIDCVRRTALGQYILHYSSAGAGIVDLLHMRHVRQNEPWIEVEEDNDFET